MQEELMSLFPAVPEVTRRKFVVTSLSAGFALAVQPIQAQTTIWLSASLLASTIGCCCACRARWCPRAVCRASSSKRAVWCAATHNRMCMNAHEHTR